MKKILLLLVFGFCASTFFAQTFVSTTPSNKNVILEEFTGKGCQYCPDGHKISNQIAAANPGRYWAVNVHAGGYASGTPNYTSTDGNTIHNYYLSQISGYPCGMINRGGILNRGSWSSATNTQLSQSSYVNVAAQGVLDGVTRVLTLTVEAYFTANGAATNYLTVVMLQNEVIGPQSGMSYNPDYIVDGQYRHMHMLRDIITEAWGDPITTTTTGSFYTHTYTYTVPEQIGDVPVVIENLEFLVWISGDHQPIITGNQAIVIDPKQPTNVAAVQEEGTLNVTIGWSNPPMFSKSVASTLTGFNVYRDGVKLNAAILPASQHTYTDAVAQYGKSYCYEIKAVIDGTESAGSKDCVFMDVDVPPVQNISVSQVAPNDLNMTISWEAPNVSYPITGYNVYRNNIKVTPTPITTTTLENKGLSFREYCFVIETVVNELLEKSEEEKCITLEKVPIPTNLVAQQISSISFDVKLTWEAVTTNEPIDGYNIYRDDAKVNTTIVTDTTYSDVVSAYNVTYCYRVKTVYKDIEGDPSAQKCIMLSNESIPPPTNMAGSQIGTSLEVTLSWAAPAIAVDGYYIYRGGEKITTELVTDLTYNNVVPAYGEYCYTAVSVLNNIEGSHSNETCVNVTDPSTINENNLDAAVRIFPNPVSDMLNIQSDIKIESVQIFDVQGRLVYSSNNVINEISTEKWASGVYILRVATENGIINKRIVRK